MRKIDLTPYDVTIPNSEGKMEVHPFGVKDSIVAGMYHQDLKLGYRELFEHDRVAQKIQKANGSVLLEDAEYEKVKIVFETLRGFGKEDVELVRRVMEAPEVTVKEGE